VQVVLRFLGRLATRLVASVVVVFAVLFVASKTPFLDSQGSSALHVSDSRSSGDDLIAVSDSFAAQGVSAIDGTLVSPEGVGFDLQEVLVAGTCTNAGHRYIQSQCPDCLVLESQDSADQANVLIWSEGGNSQSDFKAIFQHCTEETPEGALVPLVTLHERADALNLRENAAIVDGRVAPVPLPFSGAQISAFKLGSWHVVEQDLGDEQDVLQQAQNYLTTRGWRLPEGQSIQQGAEQLTFVSASGELLVVTLRREIERTTLITLLHTGGELSP